jgi:tRNA(Ile)-lysidine synthase
MPGPAPAVAAVRVAVRRALEEHDLLGSHVIVACSGGADSLALAAGAAFVVPRHGGTAGAVVVDHGLQHGSTPAAATAAQTCRRLGLDPVQVVPVSVATSGSGVEDAARTARLSALATAAAEQGATAVLLGHTLDDQAEQVLLGLVRGSGATSLSGMPPARLHGDPPVMLLRPLLAVPRRHTLAACGDLGLTPWVDPHNDEVRYTRVRARQLLPVLEDRLGPGVTAALARTADLLRDDATVLDDLCEAAYRRMGEQPWLVEQLMAHPPAIRRRLWRRLALAHGVPAGALGATHLLALDALVARWHGQGPVDLPGGVRAHRNQGRVWLQGTGPS